MLAVGFAEYELPPPHAATTRAATTRAPPQTQRCTPMRRVTGLGYGAMIAKVHRSNQSHSHGVIVSNGPAKIAFGGGGGNAPATSSGATVEPGDRDPMRHRRRTTRPRRHRALHTRRPTLTGGLSATVSSTVTYTPRCGRYGTAARGDLHARRRGSVPHRERPGKQRAPVAVKTSAPRQLPSPCHEFRERLLDRLGDEVERDVVDRVEEGAAHLATHAARGGRHPAPAVRDPRERKLLGKVVELVPLVVVRCSAGSVISVNEKNPTLTLSSSVTSARHRARRSSLARSRRAGRSVVTHLDVPDPARAAAVDRDRLGVHRTDTDGPEEARVVRHPQRHLAAGKHRLRQCPWTQATRRARRRRLRARCPSAGRPAARPAACPCTGRSPSSSSVTKPMVASNASSRRREVGSWAHPRGGESYCQPMGAGTWESHHAITSLMYRYAEIHRRRGFRCDRAALPRREAHQRRCRGRRRRWRRDPRSSIDTRTECTTTAPCVPVT